MVAGTSRRGGRSSDYTSVTIPIELLITGKDSAVCETGEQVSC